MARPKTTVCPSCKRGRLAVDPETGKLEEHQLSEGVSAYGPGPALFATVSMRCPGSDAVCSEWMEPGR